MSSPSLREPRARRGGGPVGARGQPALGCLGSVEALGHVASAEAFAGGIGTADLDLEMPEVRELHGESMRCSGRRAALVTTRADIRTGLTDILDTVTLTEDLCTWVQEQPVWQQDLSRRLLAHARLDGEAYAAAFRVVLAEHQALAQGEHSEQPGGVELEDFPAAARDGDTPRLKAFGRLRGVGAVVDDGELRFGTEGLTVVFGGNGAGKSSYVAALKKVCRAVDCAGELRGNVFGALPAQQTAMLETITSAQGAVSRQVNLREPQEPTMSAISVFDTQMRRVVR
jgi:hypothetical protein